MGGWASNSKYPFLGIALLLKWYLMKSLSVLSLSPFVMVESLNLTDIVLAQKIFGFCVPLFPMFVVFFISALAETNRPPFDLPEAGRTGCRFHG